MRASLRIPDDGCHFIWSDRATKSRTRGNELYGTPRELHVGRETRMRFFSNYLAVSEGLQDDDPEQLAQYGDVPALT